MEVKTEDITVAWGQSPHPMDHQYGKWRMAVFQDVQESIDGSKLYFLYDPQADEQSGTSGDRKGYPGLIIFYLYLRCFAGEIPIHCPGKMKFLFALKCPSPQGGTAFVLVTEESIYDQCRLNILRVDMSQDGLSIANIRSLINQPISIGGEYICSMREDIPELVVMANPGLQIWQVDCMSEFSQSPVAQFSVPGADLNHFYDAFLNNGNIIFLSATPDGHFDNTRVHLLNLSNPQHISSRNLTGDPNRGMPIPRKQCGFDSVTNAILMAGGEVERANGYERLLDYWVLNTQTFQWLQIPSQMPCPLIEPRLTASHSGTIYVWGDYDQPLPGMPQGTHLRILRVEGFDKACYPNHQVNPGYPSENEKNGGGGGGGQGSHQSLYPSYNSQSNYGQSSHSGYQSALDTYGNAIMDNGHSGGGSVMDPNQNGSYTQTSDGQTAFYPDKKKKKKKCSIQ